VQRPAPLTLPRDVESYEYSSHHTRT
jgi:hypothetical protein